MDFLKIFTENKIVESVGQLQNIAKTTTSLMSLISDNKVSTSVKEMLKGLRTVITERPNITSVNHYINHFLLQIDPENQPIVIKELLEVFHERWKNVDRKTADIAINEFNFENKKIILHGKDIAIISLLEKLDISSKKFTAIQIISKQDTIGKEQATILAEKNIKITAIDDAQTGKYIADCDVVLLGCDIIMNDVFVTKTGAYALLLAAKFLEKPVYVLADSRKILNKKYFSQNVIDTIIGTNKKSNINLWKNAPENIDVVFNVLEEVPNNLVTKFILEKETLTLENINDYIDKVLITKFI